VSVWHPFTQHALQPPAIRVARAEGAWLETADGKRLLDGISSWWVITHGHCHPRIVEAIKRQAATLDQVIFAGFTHEPAEQLAERLLKLLPPRLRHIFFSDSGSTSVEVALKMALGYWRHRGEPARRRFAALEHGYHGDTIGAMSVGARSVFNESYEPLLFDVDRIPFPRAGREQRTLDALESLCRKGETAAFIVEPLILGAGGMLVYDADTLRSMRAVCERHGVLFIADEVMTGWGRTGTLFACEQAGIEPDIACYAKGITGGSLPLAVTACSGPVFEAHYSTDRRRTLFHSSSYTANPIACAAACANLDIWEAEPVLERIGAISAVQRARTDSVASARACGTIAAYDFRVRDEGYLAGIGTRLAQYFVERGVLLRPLGNTVYVLPPYCITESELNDVHDCILEAAAELV
jgi:adenosylmethionine---8-amino-7-oxononanoate aminotransferase